jgi:hypothetical protein
MTRDINSSLPPTPTTLVTLSVEVILKCLSYIKQLINAIFFKQKQTFQVGASQVRDPYMLQFLDKVEPVTKSNWLYSGIINRAMENLIQQHPEIGGLYCSTLGGTLEYFQATGE